MAVLVDDGDGNEDNDYDDDSRCTSIVDDGDDC